MALRVPVGEVCGTVPDERNSAITASDPTSPTWPRERCLEESGPHRQISGRTRPLSGWQIAAVFVVATAFISQGLEWLRGELDIDPDVVAPAQYGPALAAVLTWMIFRSRMTELMPASINIRQVRTCVVLAVTSCVLFAMLLWTGYSWIDGQETHGMRSIHDVPFWTVALLWLIGAAAEEVGWRGVLQPVLENPLPRWGAAILTGLIWSFWHVPMISSGIAIAVVFIACTTVLAVLLAYLGNGSPAQRVITTSITHWLVNVAILMISGSGTGLTGLVPTLIAITATTSIVLTLLISARARARVDHGLG